MAEKRLFYELPIPPKVENGSNRFMKGKNLYRGDKSVGKM